MIAKLKGLLDSVGEDWAVIDVNGVGYLVFASSKTLARLGGVGSAVQLLIETHVREDHIHLYAFADQAERAWFRLLTTVQGVGAKVALSLQSALSSNDLALAIGAGDKTMLTRASGVGPRLAQRLITELKDKTIEIASSPTIGAAMGVAPAPGEDGEGIADALSALVNLGYRRAEVHQALLKVKSSLGAEAKTAELIRAALNELGRELAR